MERTAGREAGRGNMRAIRVARNPKCSCSCLSGILAVGMPTPRQSLDVPRHRDGSLEVGHSPVAGDWRRVHSEAADSLRGDERCCPAAVLETFEPAVGEVSTLVMNLRT